MWTLLNIILIGCLIETRSSSACFLVADGAKPSPFFASNTLHAMLIRQQLMDGRTPLQNTTTKTCQPMQ